MSNITISLSGNDKTTATHTFPVDAFTGVEPEFAAVAEKPQFVVGLDAAGQVRRVVSESETDRPVVAALVGTWIAAGLRIQYADGFVALAKLVRKAAAAEKEARANEPGGDALTGGDAAGAAAAASAAVAAAAAAPAEPAAAAAEDF